MKLEIRVTQDNTNKTRGDDQMNTDDKPTQLNPAFATLADELRDITAKAKDQAEVAFKQLQREMQKFIQDWGLQQLPFIRGAAANRQDGMVLSRDITHEPVRTFVGTSTSYAAFKDIVTQFLESAHIGLKVIRITSEGSYLYVSVSWEK